MQIGYIVNLICKMFAIGWRIALGLQCGFSLILVIGMLFLPETPRYAASESCIVVRSSSFLTYSLIEVVGEEAQSRESPKSAG